MKKLFLIAAALFTAISFNACTNDDHENGGGSSGIRLVSQIIYQNENGKTNIHKFDYDNQDRVTRITSDNGYTEFTYSGNKVTIIEHYEWVNNDIYHETYHATLNEQGYIETLSEDDGSISYYSYDKNGYVSRLTWNDADHDVQCTWSNGDLIHERITGDDPIDCNYEYTDYPAKQNIDIYAFTCGYCHVDDPELIGAVGLVGRKNAHLIKSDTSSEGDYTSFSYELDSNGNPTKVTETYEYETEYRTRIYKILYK